MSSDEETEATCIMDAAFVVPTDLVKYKVSKAKISERISVLSDLYKLQNGGTNSLEFCGSVGGNCARATSVPARTKGSAGHMRVSKVENLLGPQTAGVDPSGLIKTPSPTRSGRKFDSNISSVKNGTYGVDEHLTATADHGATTIAADGGAPDVNIHRSADDASVPLLPNTKVQADVKPVLKMEQVPAELQARITETEATLNITPSNLADVYERQKKIEEALLRLNNGIVAPPPPKCTLFDYETDITLDDIDEEIWALEAKIKKKRLDKAFTRDS